MPRVSIVIPVLDESRDIGRLLQEISDQIPPDGDFEVLVADGGSLDGTQRIVSEHASRDPRVRLLANPGRRSSAGRNVGAREAKGEYVLFLDGHCRLPRRDYLVRLVELFRETGASCLCRPQPLDRLAATTWAEAISAARHSPLGHNAGSDIYDESKGFTRPASAGAAYHRSCFERVGGYDERFDACEDVEFNVRIARAGFRAYKHPDLRVDYQPRSSLKSLFKQMLRYGRGRARLMARHPSETPFALVSATLWILLCVAALLALRPRVGLILFGVPVAILLVVVAIESLRLGGARPRAARIALAFLTIYSGLTLGFWRGSLDAPRFRRPATAAQGLHRPGRLDRRLTSSS